MEDKVFILDAYNKYDRNDDVRMVFSLYSKWYCIREVGLEWGIPAFEERNIDDEYSTYHIFESFEEAQEAVRGLRQWEGVKF